jgi:hypothetical protein
LYAYLRRRGYQAEQSQDLTQEFFVHVLRSTGIVPSDSSR